MKNNFNPKWWQITILISMMCSFVFAMSLPNKDFRQSNKHSISFTIEVKDIDYTEKELEDFIYYYLESEGHLDSDNPFLEYGLLELNIDNIKITRK